MPIISTIIEKKEQVHIDHIETWKKIELNFSSWYDKNKTTTSTSRYDYWGVRTYYKENTWIKFSIQTQEDIDLIKKIKENKSDWYKNLSENEEKINTLFEWNLYKLK